MRKLLALLALLPVTVLAIDTTDRAKDYSDAPFSRPEAAAISVLTNADVIEGNPDGTFASRRTLNRAEFAKIVSLLSGHEAAERGANKCFPDVQEEWFAAYVCFLKEEGSVQGNPDGLFHPERSVNYAEAVKMLAKNFDYELTSNGEEAWYAPYVRAAEEHKTALPIALAPDHALTRGHMARLAAAFLAESDGELAAYRAAEMGKTLSSSSSVSSASSASSSSLSSSSVSSVSSVSSASSSSSSPTAQGFPSRTQLLVLGERSKPIASATFFAAKEPMSLRFAEIVLEREINSIESMFLLDSRGVQIGQIALDHLYDSTDKTWRGSFSAGTYTIPKDEERTLGIEVRLKERGKGGVSEELVEVNNFRVTMQGEFAGGTINSASNSFAYPKHQTAQGRITAVKNALDETAAPPVGTNQQVAGFRFFGSAVPGAEVRIENLEFQVSKSSDVTITGWQLGTADSPDRHSCSVNVALVSCSNIPASFGTITTQRTLYLYGNVSLESGAINPYIQVSLNQPGTIGELGAIQWTDGSGHFTWTELESPIARSTRFE